MGSRGRRSAAAAGLTLITGNGIESAKRPPPPPSLSKEAAEEWKAIVSRLPPEWFPRETHPLLVQLCRLIVRSHQIAKLLETAKKLSPEQYMALLRSEQALSKSIATLSTKMRISQQSTYDKRKRKDHVPKAQPWEDDDETSEDEADAG